MTTFKVENNEIRVPGKVITKLDLFVLEGISIIEQFTEYVIISGYVSIFFGRARGTEDIDLFISDPGDRLFTAMYNSFAQSGFECTAEKADAYQFYLKSSLPICFWKKGLPLLRLEIKLATKPSQILQLKDKMDVVFDHNHLWMSSIEAQIAYKRFIAGSDKDLKDARHLEIVFPQYKPEKVKSYKLLFEQDP